MHSQQPATARPARSSEILAISPSQAAEISSLSLRTITAAIASGELRSFKKGRRRVIFRADLVAYLRSTANQ